MPAIITLSHTLPSARDGRITAYTAYLMDERRRRKVYFAARNSFPGLEISSTNCVLNLLTRKSLRRFQWRCLVDYKKGKEGNPSLKTSFSLFLLTGLGQLECGNKWISFFVLPPVFWVSRWLIAQDPTRRGPREKNIYIEGSEPSTDRK